MAKAIWLVIDKNNILGTFSSRRRMIKALYKRYSNVNLTYDDNGQLQSDAIGFLHVSDGCEYSEMFETHLKLLRRKVDDWTING